jgi:hypothetical protein
MDNRKKKELLNIFNKALKLFRKEKWEKASELFKEAGYLAHEIRDKETEKDCVEYMEKCMIRIQKEMDNKEKNIEDSFSKLYD